MANQYRMHLEYGKGEHIYTNKISRSHNKKNTWREE
jgi:hypothetical protein